MVYVFDIYRHSVKNEKGGLELRGKALAYKAGEKSAEHLMKILKNNPKPVYAVFFHSPVGRVEETAHIREEMFRQKARELGIPLISRTIKSKDLGSLVTDKKKKEKAEKKAGGMAPLLRKWFKGKKFGFFVPEKKVKKTGKKYGDLMSMLKNVKDAHVYIAAVTHGGAEKERGPIEKMLEGFGVKSFKQYIKQNEGVRFVFDDEGKLRSIFRVSQTGDIIK